MRLPKGLASAACPWLRRLRDTVMILVGPMRSCRRVGSDPPFVEDTSLGSSWSGNGLRPSPTLHPVPSLSCALAGWAWLSTWCYWQALAGLKEILLDELLVVAQMYAGHAGSSGHTGRMMERRMHLSLV